jgi:hypothetical protein
MENMKIWSQVKRPPKDALRQIQAGRLKGKSDINPQWRFQAMTELFGPIGIGWRFEIVRVWQEAAHAGQVFAFAEVNVWYKHEGEESYPLNGIGGSMLIVQEKNGIHSSDEGYKMAVTDAFSVAVKPLGIAADVYMGLWDGSKYVQSDLSPDEVSPLTTEQKEALISLMAEVGGDEKAFCKYFKIKTVSDIAPQDYQRAMEMVEKKRKTNA